MIFLTVGTYPLSFDRLICAIDNLIRDGLISEKVFAQIGDCGKYEPRHMEYVKIMDKDSFDKIFYEASGIISHAGIGVITMALECEKAILVMPRMRKYKEIVNDHQIETAEKFEQLGHILAAYDEKDLSVKIKQLASFMPKKRIAQVDEVAERISKFLRDL